MAKFKQAVVAGTFNCIHAGHLKLLRTALEAGERVLIGLTSDEFARKLKGNAKPYEERKKALVNAIGKEMGRCEIVKIEDEIGIAGESEKPEAIVVSTETEPNARKVNEARRAKGLHGLEVIVIELVKDERGVKLSCRRRAK